MTFTHNEIDYDFVIETAPLNTVPHAIHLFLEQVEHGLWTGSYFYINTMNVLQAGPSSPKGIEDLANSSNRKRFEDLQLDKLAFPDYSHEFAHHAWTVGFMSRPGGPDIYINKMDNSRVHGPGGQKQHILDEQGDACFGRITKGKEHIESILFKYAVMGEGKYQFAMRKQVPIVRAIILTPKPQAATPMDLEEIPEPMEIRFGRSLKEALAPLEQTLIESPAMNADLTDDVVGTSTSKTTNETKAAKELLKKNTTSDYNKTTIDTKTAANVASKNDAVDVDVQL